MIFLKYKAALLFIGITLLSACANNEQGAQQDTTATATAKTKDKTKPTKTVLFFGDSLTAGYGLDDPETESYPAVIQQKIKEANLPYQVVNAGNSGEISAGGKNRIDWVLRQKVDVFVLELGANDGLRGIPVSETTRNLQTIINHVKSKYPDAKLVLTGMQIPPSMGADYATQFKSIFPKLAAKNNMAFVPFLLKGVGGVSALNQADGIHPTKDGARVVANNVWQELKKVL